MNYNHFYKSMEILDKTPNFSLKCTSKSDNGYISWILHIYLRLRSSRVIFKKVLKDNTEPKTELTSELCWLVANILKYKNSAVDIKKFRSALHKYIPSFTNPGGDNPQGFLMAMLVIVPELCCLQNWELNKSIILEQTTMVNE